MSYSFGVEPNEIALNILGYSVQNILFKDMAGVGGDNYLHTLALTCGLIGFTAILIAPRKMDVFKLVSWLLLVALIFARPLSESLFFTSLTTATAPQLAHKVPYGGSYTDSEFTSICSNTSGGDNSSQTANEVCNSMPTYQQMQDDKLAGILGTSSTTTSDQNSSYAFTPELALSSALNGVNTGLTTSLMPLGKQALDASLGPIEAVKRGSVSDNESVYAISEFLNVCGRKVPEVNDKAYMPFGELRTKFQDIDQRLKNATFTAADALGLFLFYKDTMDAQGAVPVESGSSSTTSSSNTVTPVPFPVLACTYGKCDGSDFSTGDSEMDAVLKEITANAANFKNDYYHRGTVWKDVVGAVGKLGGNDVERKQKLTAQKVSLAVPFNFTSSLPGNDTSSADSAGAKGNSLQNIGNAIVGGETGAAIGGAIAGVAALVVGGLLVATGIGAPAGVVLLGIATTALGAGVGAYCGVDKATKEDWLHTAGINLDFGQGTIALGEKSVAEVDNCEDYFKITDARLAFSFAKSQRLQESLETIIGKYGPGGQKDKLPANFAGMSPQDQSIAALRLALSNKDITPQQFTNLMATARSSTFANGALPVARASMDALNSQSKFSSTSRNFGSWLGGFFQPAAVLYKGFVGGVEAGSYAQTMPMIIYFASALVLMLTPILFMLGLLIPFWSMNAIIMPLLTIGYLDMVKITFTLVHTFSMVFVQASNAGIYDTDMSKFIDILLESGYTLAFLLTAALMFSLRNPAAIIEKMSGADAAATVVKTEHIMGLMKSAAKMAVPVAGKALAIAEVGGAALQGSGENGEGGGVGAALGAMAGGVGKALIAPVMDAKDKAMTNYAERDARLEHAGGKDYKYYKNRATGRYLKQEEEDMASLARASGNGAMNRTYTMGDGHGGHEKVDSMIDTLASALRKGGLQAGQAFKQAADYMEREGRGGMGKMMSADKDARGNGSIIYRMSEDGAKALAAGGLKGQSLEKMKAKMGDSFFEYTHKRKDGTSFKSYGFVARKGPEDTTDYKKDYEEK